MDGTNLTRRSLAAYDRPVPRYTSYPTAAQFHADVGPADHRAWLAALPDARATVYLHVPFCRQLCWYCACNTSAMNRKQPLEDYAQALIREIDLVADAVPHLLVGRSSGAAELPRSSGPRASPRSPDISRRGSTAPAARRRRSRSIRATATRPSLPRWRRPASRA